MALISAIALPAFAGCSGGEPTRFYLLTPIAEEASTMPSTGMAVGVGPVALPRYLVRPQIVTQVDGNELQLTEFNQWGGELEDNFTRVLGTNIALLLPTEEIALYPWGAGPAPPIDYQVLIDITSFERDGTGDCVLTAFWRIARGDGSEILMTHRSSFREPVGVAAAGDAAADSYQAIAAAMSKNVERLSREIVEALRAL
jgi:hypothetical protein